MQSEARRAIQGLAAVAVAAAGLVRLAWLPGVGLSGLPGALSRTSPDRSLPLVLALALAAFAGWLALTLLVAFAARRPGTAGRCAQGAFRRLAPAAVRHALEAALGLTTVLASTAGAAHAAAPLHHPATSQSVTSLDRPAAAAPAASPPVASPTFDLDRPAAPVHHQAGQGLALVTTVPRKMPAAQAIAAQPVVVRPGDSLWRIASRALPRGATTADIERAWPRWYRANRAVIGTDPGLLQPGQHLTPPSPEMP